MGVYRIDQVLVEVQPFTEDARRSAKGVDRALAPRRRRSRPARTASACVRCAGAARLGAPDTAGPQGGSPAAIRGPLGAESSGVEIGRSMDALRGSRSRTAPPLNAEYKRVQLELSMLEAREALERDQQGLTTVNSLLALVNGLKNRAGRKAIVFFSEGLVIPPRVAPAMQAVVAEANRGGVTFYTADADGLRVVSSASETRRDLASVQEITEQADQAHARPA